MLKFLPKLLLLVLLAFPATIFVKGELHMNRTVAVLRELRSCGDVSVRVACLARKLLVSCSFAAKSLSTSIFQCRNVHMLNALYCSYMTYIKDFSVALHVFLSELR